MSTSNINGRQMFASDAFTNSSTTADATFGDLKELMESMESMPKLDPFPRGKGTPIIYERNAGDFASWIGANKLDDLLFFLLGVEVRVSAAVPDSTIAFIAWYLPGGYGPNLIEKIMRDTSETDES